jgi:hypothetical protein
VFECNLHNGVQDGVVACHYCRVIYYRLSFFTAWPGEAKVYKCLFSVYNFENNFENTLCSPYFTCAVSRLYPVLSPKSYILDWLLHVLDPVPASLLLWPSTGHVLQLPSDLASKAWPSVFVPLLNRRVIDSISTRILRRSKDFGTTPKPLRYVTHQRAWIYFGSV